MYWVLRLWNVRFLLGTREDLEKAGEARFPFGGCLILKNFRAQRMGLISGAGETAGGSFPHLGKMSPRRFPRAIHKAIRCGGDAGFSAGSPAESIIPKKGESVTRGFPLVRTWRQYGAPPSHSGGRQTFFSLQFPPLLLRCSSGRAHPLNE